MKIVILDGCTTNPGDLSWAGLEAFGNLTVYPNTDSQEEAISRIGDSEIVIVNKVLITRELLDACPSIRLVCVLATGYNQVDTLACKERNIPVCNVPTYSTPAVAQFTIALLLEQCHKIGHHSQLVHDGAWTRCQNFCFWSSPQLELWRKTLGIIGFGRIGQAVAKIAKSLGMNILVTSRTHYPQFAGEVTYVDMDTLLANSDVITLHCPLFPETTEIINKDTIAKMKDGVILLNTSRGGLVNEQDLADALHSGKIAAAAVDVVTKEPIQTGNPLLSAPNCTITPHMAWAPLESRRRLLECVAGNIAAFLNGHPQNVVNP